jgi:hypothetical protein
MFDGAHSRAASDMLSPMSVSNTDDGSQSALHQRIVAVAGDRTFRHLGELTGIHPETVRRYMTGQAPSTEFLTGLCRGLGINGDWMLTGRGPMRVADVQMHALREAAPPDLLSALAFAIEALINRVERVEHYLQTMETRLRVAYQSSPSDGAGVPMRMVASDGHRDSEEKDQGLNSHDATPASTLVRLGRQTGSAVSAASDVNQRVGALLEALPQRPSAIDGGVASRGGR